MCGGQYLRGASQGIADQRGTTITSSTIDRKPGKLNDFMFRGGRARGPELNQKLQSKLNAQKKATPKKETTPPVQRSNPESRLNIRRSGGSKTVRTNSSRGSRATARKRFRTK